MKKTDLSDHISSTYRTLRLGIAFIAFALPLLLWIGGHLLADLPLQDSMSAYYHAHGEGDEAGPPGGGVMRDVFVGVLIAVGTILFLYKGITRLENYALNLAGVLALGVAVFPMKWPSGADDGGFSAHGACAVVFFVCIAYVCIFRASDTLPLIKDELLRGKYRRWYRFLGWAMPVSPLAAWILTLVLDRKGSLVFYVEALGVYVFAAFWLIKSREIAAINSTHADVARDFKIEPCTLSDAFRAIPLSPVNPPGG